MSARSARRRRAEAYLSQPYVAKLNMAIEAGAIPLIPGAVAHLDVKHDGWCPKLRGGLCRCQPDLEVRWEPTAEVQA